MSHSLRVIARLHSDFSTKFGVPRQSGLVEALRAAVIFEPEFRVPEAVRGLEEFSHLWLIWQFSQNQREDWSPTVRPPRLGGNRRLGVFATRSPFRPNPLGLSAVGLESVELHTPKGPVLHVSGADLMDGTPIYDIKPYLPYAGRAWRWTVPRRCWSGCRRRSGRPCWACWRRIPGPPTRTTRRGSTVCPSPAWRSASPRRRGG